MQDLDLNHKKVLLRADFNVPLDNQFRVTDDTRIRATIPTIRYLLDQGASVIIMSHLGRPLKKLREDGTVDREKFSLRHVIPTLAELLGRQVAFAQDCIGPEAAAAVSALEEGGVLLLENTRFHAGEEKGSEEMAQQLAGLGDVYINDAFGTAHRAHASTAVIARYFDSAHKAFGLLMQSELDGAARILNQPARPLTAIIGGAKVSDKILLLERLSGLADHLIIGGGMAYTFVRAQGGETGNSLVEEDRIELARELLEKSGDKVQIHLPADSVVADAFSNDAARKVTDSQTIPQGWMGLDIGPSAIEAFSAVIRQSGTILWNGPMGVFEMEHFATGTRHVAQAVAEATEAGAYSLVGGGDSVAAVNQMGLAGKVSYVSTGGGAMLELLEGKDLPGIAAIRGDQA